MKSGVGFSALACRTRRCTGHVREGTSMLCGYLSMREQMGEEEQEEEEEEVVVVVVVLTTTKFGRSTSMVVMIILRVARNSDYTTPLHFAAADGHADAVKLLLSSMSYRKQEVTAIRRVLS
eukprot:767692-Hanusia_phi.AAC.2